MNSYPIRTEYAELPETEIVTLCQKGDLEAFNVLISRYEGKVLNLTRRYLRDYHAAVDEAQEVFLRVFRKIKSFKGESSFRTWLYRVASNHCLNVIERQRRHPQDERALSLDDPGTDGENRLHEVIADPKAPSPEGEFSENEVRQKMVDAINRLPADQRQTLVLFHYEELSYQQIADIMEVPVSTVCSCIYRARQQLKKILSKEKRGHG